MLHTKYTTEFTREVEKAINLNDVKIIETIMHPNSYKNLTKDEKEMHCFFALYVEFCHYDKGEELIKYLIFDYQISEKAALASIQKEFYPEVKQMFELRQINQDLNKNLNNKNIKSKNPKI